MSVEKQTAAHLLHTTRMTVMLAAEAKAREEKAREEDAARRSAAAATRHAAGAASRGQSAELNGQQPSAPTDAAGAQSAEMNQQLSYAEAKALLAGGLGKADPLVCEAPPEPEPITLMDLDDVRFDGSVEGGTADAEGQAETHLDALRKGLAQGVRGTSGEAARYTVDAGDSLWKIAEKLYGDGAAWIELRDANPELGDGELLYPGQELVIPMSESEKADGSSLNMEALDDPCGPLGSKVSAVSQSVYVGTYMVGNGMVTVTADANASLAVQPVGQTCAMVANVGQAAIDYSAIADGALTNAFTLSIGEERLKLAASFASELGEASISFEPVSRMVATWSNIPVSLEHGGWRLSGKLGLRVNFDYMPGSYAEPISAPEVFWAVLPAARIKWLVPLKWKPQQVPVKWVPAAT